MNWNLDGRSIVLEEACVLGNENDTANADSNNIVFTVKDTKLYVPVVTLAKDLKVWCTGTNIKSENKNMTD